MLEVFQFHDIEEYLRIAGPTLYEREAENSLMLGLCQSFVVSKNLPQDVLLLVVLSEGRVTTAAVQTPPYNLIISASDNDSLDVLARFVHSRERYIPGVVGPKKDATEFATKWSQVSQKSFYSGMDQKIYQVQKVRDPNVGGSLKIANNSLIDLVAIWLFEFSQESLPAKEKFKMDFALESAVKAVDTKSAYIWMNTAGIPVSVAHTGRPTKNGISIRAVYTPPTFRKKGYASAVVAGISQQMLNEKYSFCCLYTDASNPTSNKIYEAVGYEKVADSHHFIFEE